jgi:hypothetical protein
MFWRFSMGLREKQAEDGGLRVEELRIGIQ